MDQACSAVLNTIDRHGQDMTLEDYIAFLECIQLDIEARLLAARSDTESKATE